MKRMFDYEEITIADIENNDHLIFICDGDSKRITLEEENNE